MTESYQQEFLQPSLLDRLTDDSRPQIQDDLLGTGTVELLDANRELKPLSKTSLNVSDRQSGRSGRLFLTARKLRKIVKRDLGWLLNSSCLEDVEDLSDYPNVAQSVLNFGMPGFAGGKTVASIDVRELERRFKQVIINFEPRILKKTLQVKVITSKEMSRSALQLEIDCEIWGQNSLEQLVLKSDIDLETGSVAIVDRKGA